MVLLRKLNYVLTPNELGVLSDIILVKNIKKSKIKNIVIWIGNDRSIKPWHIQNGYYPSQPMNSIMILMLKVYSFATE